MTNDPAILTELKKRPETFEEFQQFYFHSEPTCGFQELQQAWRTASSSKPRKLALWNARKIKANWTKNKNWKTDQMMQDRIWQSSPLTKAEIVRIHDLFDEEEWLEGPRQAVLGFPIYNGWKDSDNPEED